MTHAIPIESIKRLGKHCPFHIGQLVYLLDNCFELEVKGIRLCKLGYFEIEVAIVGGDGERWHFPPESLKPVHENRKGHLIWMDGGKQ